jgi:capsular polysaccharide transport system permease protein
MSPAEPRLQLVAEGGATLAAAASAAAATAAAPAAESGVPPARRRWRDLRLPWFLKPMFLLVVLLPTLLAGWYYGLHASDVYIAEARFVLRSPERAAASPLGQFLRGAGFARAQDDSYAVQDFMLSRDALRALDAQIGLRQAFSDRSVDRLNRFAALDGDDSFEALHLYYRKKVTLALDGASSIATLTTRAFTAEDAHAMNLLLLEMGEALVNQLNTRGRADLVRFAAADVAEAETRAKAAALALAAYRTRENVLDIDRQATLALQ